MTQGALAGCAVLVTGGGTGIGAACAERLACDGAAVTICGRTESKLAETTTRVSELAAGAGTIGYLVADVTVEDDVERAVAAAADQTESLDAVVANAGGGGMLARYADQTPDEFLRVLHLNVLGTMLLLKHSLPRLAQTRGSFVGMSSIAATLTHAYFGAYPPAKAGVEAMIRNAADEYGAAGVRCNAVRPGFIATEIMQVIPRDSATYASYVANTPLGRLGEPDDVAQLVRFLVGPESAWITGQVFTVDGGMSLRRGPDYSAFVPT